MRPLFGRVALEPIYETRSDVLWTPEELSRWKNGELSISGKVVAIGPEVTGVEVGETVYHSDSCAQPFDINGNEIRIINQDDIMFMTNRPIKSYWLGAQENYDD